MASRGTGPCANVLRKLDVASIDVVSCHAVTSDEGLLALCPNSEEIHIFQLQGTEYRMFQTLAMHSQRVTGLSWTCVAGFSPRLVSCSEDRTAFVWERGANLQWTPVQVELSSPKAALCVEWSPNGDRFAVGLASKDTAICYWAESVESWIAVKVGFSKASVVSVGWHPNSQYLVTGSADCRVQVYDVNEENMLPAARPPFGELQLVHDTGSFVNAVFFSTSGHYLGYLTQDSTVGIKDLSLGPDAVAKSVRWRGLPFTTGTFLNDRSLVACGFDCVPVLFQKSGSEWQCMGSIDAMASVPQQRVPKVAASGAFAEARQRFGAAPAATEPAPASSSHSGVILSCKLLSAIEGPNRADEAPRFSTSGQDGLVFVWEALL